MPTRIVLLALVPALLAAQTPRLDGGKLDPAWFGPAVSFQPARDTAFQWLTATLSLRDRVVRVKPWESSPWLAGPRGDRDRFFLRKVEDHLPSMMEKGLRKGLAGLATVSRTEGDLVLSGRVVDAQGSGEDGMFTGAATLTLDLKLTDLGTGALLGAFHHTVRALSEEACLSLFEDWCHGLGRQLRDHATQPRLGLPAPKPSPPESQTSPPPPPAFDLETTLLRLESLRRDGILSEAEYRALRAKAEGKARTK